MRLIRFAILISIFYVLMVPAYAQDENEELTQEERQAIRQQENWDEAVRRIVEAAETNAIELDLSRLQLTQLPAQFYELTQLETINLSGNYLREWSSDIGNLVNLRHVDLSNNNVNVPVDDRDLYSTLFFVPHEFYELPHLEVLILRYNFITSIPPEISRLSSLRVLDLSYTPCLDTLPDELAELPNLEILDFDVSHDTQIPDVIFRLSNLHELYIFKNSGDSIIQIPPTIKNLTELEVLKIRGNITGLPTEISRLSNLHTLNLGNQLTRLPPEIYQIPNLRVLNLNGNEIGQLPANIGELTNLEELHLNGNYLSSLPDSIGNLSNLEVLDLGFNDITSLPPTIGNLHQLWELDLTQNLLSSLPSEIGQLDNLEILYLIANHLTELPSEIGSLSNLTHLHVRENHLTELPDEIGNLSQLQVLSLGSRFHHPFMREHHEGNQITALPASIGNLGNLRQLWLSRNPIESLPASIGRLKNLEVLMLDYTNISRLPFSVADMSPELRIWLYVRDETQLFPPVEIWLGDTEDIKHYLWWHRFWWWRVLPVSVVVGLYAFYRLIGWLWMRRQGAWVGKKKKKRNTETP